MHVKRILLMIVALLKGFIKFADIYIASQYPSVLGYGHQIISSKAHDGNVNFIIKTIKSLSGSLSVLEIACGQGTLLVELARLHNIKKIKGVDLDTKALEIARNKAINTVPSADITFEYLNFLNTYINTHEKYDIIIADKFLHILTEPEICQVLFNASSLLKSSGIFFINTVSVNNFVYSRTIKGNSQSIHRILKDDLFTRCWYNVNNPIISFLNREWLIDNGSRYGFLYEKDLEYYNDSNYLTVALRRL